ncbi:unnamed protein product [Heligmosomoides polygyrus]|uniref:tRNA-synt_2 domain-containing protein n=1 Tax=Heligmosomoides polygyrus TaxID=6339 RepID=A0A183GAV2_HELPZ|nr:unnamed protein product [Heligmosomoides polygyrus]
MDRKMVLNRWRTYFEGVSTVEFAYPDIPSLPTIYGPVQNITVEEIEAALKKMKPGKAKGPDNSAADLWKLVPNEVAGDVLQSGCSEEESA